MCIYYIIHTLKILIWTYVLYVGPIHKNKRETNAVHTTVCRCVVAACNVCRTFILFFLAHQNKDYFVVGGKGGGIGGAGGRFIPLAPVDGAGGVGIFIELLPPFPLLLLLLLLLPSPPSEDDLVCNNQGCWRQSFAVARLDGVAFKHGRRKLASCSASSGVMRYFSVSTFLSGHSFKFLMCFKSPFLLKNCDEYRPLSATFFGMPPRSSITCAK